jgi:hypothetical protein
MARVEGEVRRRRRVDPERDQRMSFFGSHASSAASGTPSTARKNQIAAGKAAQMPCQPNGRKSEGPALPASSLMSVRFEVLNSDRGDQHAAPAALGEPEVPAGEVAGDDVRDSEAGQQDPPGRALLELALDYSGVT